MTGRGECKNKCTVTVGLFDRGRHCSITHKQS